MKIDKKGPFNRKTTRLKNWDYRNDSVYFITMCTSDREHYFGKIKDGKMHLSNVGVLANVLWYEIKNHSKNVILDEFVVMPDHIHGILIIDGNDKERQEFQVSSDFLDFPAPPVPVGTGHALSQRYENALSQPKENALSQPNDNALSQRYENALSQPKENALSQREKRFQNIGKNSVSSIIGSYKSAVTKHANRLDLEFKWQQRFYDRIIRDEFELRNVRNYINRNIEKWDIEKNQ